MESPTPNMDEGLMPTELYRVTGGANDGCYRLKVNEINQPCLFRQGLLHAPRPRATCIEI